MPENDEVKTNGKVLSFSRDHSFYAKRGDAKRNQNNPVDAVAMYVEALERNPDDNDTRLAAANVLTEMGRFQDSIFMLAPLICKDEWFRKEAYCTLGFNYMGLGDTAAAGFCFDRFFELTDEVSARTDTILDALDSISRMEERDCAPAIEDVSEFELSRLEEKARVRFSSQDYAESAELLERMLTIDPNNNDVRFNLALSYLCDKKLDRALDVVNVILDAEPENISALCMKLVLVKNSGSQAELDAIREQIEKVDISTPNNLMHTAASMCEIGMYEQALPYVQKLYKLSPYNTEISHLYAQCLIAAKHYGRAVQVYDKLLKLEKYNHTARTFRAKCLAALKNDGTVEPVPGFKISADETLYSFNKLNRFQNSSPEDAAIAWKTDPEIEVAMLNIMKLNQFMLSYTVIAQLSSIADKCAESCLRKCLLVPGLSGTLSRMILSMLSDMGADMPCLVYCGDGLAEAYLPVQVSRRRVPKQYSMIPIRCMEHMAELYGIDVISAMTEISEGFISRHETFPKLTAEQSAAVSAAIECLACRRCKTPIAPNLLERYGGVTERRLANAIDRVYTVLTGSNGNQEDGE